MGKFKNFLATIAVAATAILSLTLVASAATYSEDSTDSYDLVRAGRYWSGDFPADIANNTISFLSSSNYAALECDEGKGSIIGKSGYTGNYKIISVTLKNADGVSKKTTNWGTFIWVSAKPKISGPYANATFFAEIHNGTEENSEFLDGFNVKLHQS